MGGSNRRRGWGKVRGMMESTMGGLRGGTNLASWLVAASLAYFLWIKPSQDLHRQQQQRAALASSSASSSDPYNNSKPQANGVPYNNQDNTTTKHPDDS